MNHKFTSSNFLIYIVYPLCLVGFLVCCYKTEFAPKAPGVGNEAPDFSFTTCAGDTLSLYQLDSPYIILFFYDPSDTTGMKEVHRMWESTVIRAAQVNEQLQVVAFYVGNDIEMWSGFLENFPYSWINACSRDGLGQAIQKSYLANADIRPMFFLIDSRKVIRLIDEQYSELELWIRENNCQQN